jgi:5,5'-dehydrodivanillate O-demethylase
MATGTPIETQQIGLEELSKTGPESLMGQLLRRFWQPVAAAAEVPRGRPLPIRVLGEELTLYRGEGGAPHLVAARCAHRCNVLHTGWVQDDNIRCMYHGWMYDGTGQCVEAPAEDPNWPSRVRIAGYPARDYAGLVFAYLGPGEPPEFNLARHEELERHGCVRWTNRRIWPCSWFQAAENSLDAVHVSFVHRWGRLGSFGAAVTDVLPDLEYAETDSGIRQTARRSESNVRVSDWTFPNHNHIVVPGLHADDPWTHTFAWIVPADDAHVNRMVCQFSPVTGDAAQRLQDYLLTHGYEPTDEPGLYFGRNPYDPAQHHEELFLERMIPEPALSELTSAQDYVAQVGQGSIVDRSQERLGRSDAGVRFMRGIFLREMAALRDGRPLKRWARRMESTDLPPQPGPTAGTHSGWDRKGMTAVRT